MRIPGAFILLSVALMTSSVARQCGADERSPDASRFSKIEFVPQTVRLTGANSVRGVLIHGHRTDGRIVDLTHDAIYRADRTSAFAVNKNGVVSARADGRATMTALVAGKTLSIPVVVSETKTPRQFHFENDVIPIFSRFRCNTSGCHGKAEGQNGFKLSVFGFDPAADYDALTKEGRGRRVFTAVPERSLILTKASGGVPHGGGIRFFPGSREYETLHGWIAAGVPFGSADAPTVERIELHPAGRIMAPLTTQQLRATAYYSDGTDVDVTQMAKFQSNNEGLATVDDEGLIRIGKVPGQVAVMATYMGAVATFQALIPGPHQIESTQQTNELSVIDRLVDERLQQLNIAPSGICDDAEFLRRTHLDIIGRIPTAEEARRFLDDSRSDKRVQLVDTLLNRPEYADLWTLKWADLLRVDRKKLGHRQAHEYHRWIHQSFAQNKPFDQFAREILTVRGRLNNAPRSNFYRVVSKAGERANTVSQVFLGVRIACAECHHHPFDRWSQTDYSGMSAIFSQVKIKKTSRGDFLSAVGNPVTKHPRTGQRVFAHPLGEEMPAESQEGDWRDGLADWMTSPENRWFARCTANRIWAHMTGRGLVEPVDDFRDTNPPTNPKLLDALAAEFVSGGFDVQYLIRTIAASRSYQRSSTPNHTNAADEQNYSRALLKRVDAEVLFDAVTDVTGVEEKFRGVPHGQRAVQLWDSEVDHYFLKLFGRPARKTACDCERNSEPSVSQVLHVLNSPEIHRKLSHEGGRVAQLIRSTSDDAEFVKELYLTYFARRPSAVEEEIALKHFRNSTDGRRAAAEDLAWSLMNSLEFVFNH